MTGQHAHVVSYQTLLKVLGVLLILTGVTILASRIDLGPLNVWIALMIASAKCSVVLLFFMHLKYEKGRLFAVTFIVTVFCVALLIGFLFWDVAYRT